MKTLKLGLAAPLVLTLSLVAPSAATNTARVHAASENRDAATSDSTAAAQAQQQYGALERGYRTGYSDGYQAGWRDSMERAAADYGGKEDYRRADRAYIAAYGSLEDYRDGYQQGFEIGYDSGYNRRGFESEIPSGGIRRRGLNIVDRDSAIEPDVYGGPVRPGERGGQGSGSIPSGRAGTGTGSASIPSDTVMTIELLNRLSSDVSQRGDRFEARVVGPAEYAGATVSGRLTEVRRAGRTRGRSQLQLNFDQIRLTDGDWMDFSAQVIEVVNTGDDEQGEVDPEGGVRGRDSTKEDVAKVGAGAGIGAIIGGIAGGGKGAAIGAILGGAAGAGGVMTQRGEEVRLERGQQLRIRTARDSRLRDN
jgi:hypothetical protein